MKLYERLLNDGRLFKASPHRLGDKEFLTLLYLDQSYGDAWAEIGIGFFNHITDGRLKTIWYHSLPALAHPIEIPEGSLVQIEKTESGPRVIGYISPATLLNYQLTRLLPEPAPTPKRGAK